MFFLIHRPTKKKCKDFNFRMGYSEQEIVYSVLAVGLVSRQLHLRYCYYIAQYYHNIGLLDEG